eukprot:1312090-Prymnesium_polylepis.1
MVAYCELASGHEVRLHMPVRLYSLRQKVCVRVFALKEQNFWLITLQMTSSCCIGAGRRRRRRCFGLTRAALHFCDVSGSVKSRCPEVRNGACHVVPRCRQNDLEAAARGERRAERHRRRLPVLHHRRSPLRAGHHLRRAALREGGHHRVAADARHLSQHRQEAAKQGAHAGSGGPQRGRAAR